MLDIKTHRLHMYNLIQKIYQSPLKSSLGFKGGTLCMFLYNLNRFSTDLDFDLLESKSSNIDVMSELRNLILEYGKLKIKDEYEKQNTYFFLLSYGEHQKNIKLEVNKNKIIYDTYTPINLFGTNVLAMTKDAIFANKLLALSNRYKNRDLFDVHFFFKEGFPINEKIIKAKANKTLKTFLLELKNQIPKNYSETTILAEIGDLISEKQKYFMKHQIVSEVIGYIDFYLAQ
ncbi:MAG TPA: nucleotidyl transferase AbiEii/AbiGii toxin family protein [Candidatus Absconditabacterales bacterium]|nr:nucleotidyl transferase AbiEii/AbiGii toxin family protein [Candidatus Absconditabacterales bacterium]HRU50176.1 nucleotidyl transferase AbiEii/AbiGii toxin family protein [Candidatus Absconditabacterales bacterium]